MKLLCYILYIVLPFFCTLKSHEPTAKRVHFTDACDTQLYNPEDAPTSISSLKKQQHAAIGLLQKVYDNCSKMHTLNSSYDCKKLQEVHVGDIIKIPSWKHLAYPGAIYNIYLKGSAIKKIESFEKYDLYKVVQEGTLEIISGVQSYKPNLEEKDLFISVGTKNEVIVNPALFFSKPCTTWV